MPDLTMGSLFDGIGGFPLAALGHVRVGSPALSVGLFGKRAAAAGLHRLSLPPVDRHGQGRVRLHHAQVGCGDPLGRRDVRGSAGKGLCAGKIKIMRVLKASDRGFCL